ncbi:hypothetical protein Tco_0096612 [Tanacetum coccineum]
MNEQCRGRLYEEKKTTGPGEETREPLLLAEGGEVEKDRRGTKDRNVLGVNGEVRPEARSQYRIMGPQCRGLEETRQEDGKRAVIERGVPLVYAHRGAEGEVVGWVGVCITETGQRSKKTVTQARAGAGRQSRVEVGVAGRDDRRERSVTRRGRGREDGGADGGPRTREVNDKVPKEMHASNRKRAAVLVEVKGDMKNGQGEQRGHRRSAQRHGTRGLTVKDAVGAKGQIVVGDSNAGEEEVKEKDSCGDWRNAGQPGVNERRDGGKGSDIWDEA